MPFFSFLLPLLLLSPAPAARTQQPAQGAAGASDAPGTIVWSASRPLTWADFKSRPAPTEQLAALSSANIDVQVACRDFKVSSTVRAVFVPTESWVRDAAKATPALLRHEQLHFDITELYTRKMRQKISLLKLDCEHLQPKFKTTTSAVFAEWKREQTRYDQETNHGLLTDRQRGWETVVKQQLAALERFATPS